MSDIKILIVEDEAIVAEDIACHLEKMSYNVVDIVATGEAAIAIATAHHPDLVLMDIMLKGRMDGVEAAQHICSQLHLPVVFLTANTDESTLQRAKITGPFGYILKPFKETELRVTIEIAISRHQAEQEVQKALAMAEALRQEAQENIYLKNQYLSIASHEFRTPLSVIKVAAEVLQSYGHQLSEEKRQLSFQRIQSAIESMNQLLDDVLMLGQVDSGMLEVLPSPIEVVSFCEELLENFQVSEGDRYTLHLQAANPVILAYLDSKLLWHILNNLVSNAIKYSPNGSTITIHVSYQDNQLSLQVQDQGMGIPASHMKHLFEPFRRADNVGDIPGTGLGLAIVKRSVDLQGGQIEVESTINQGSIFTITLPRHLSPRSSCSPHSTPRANKA